MQLRDDGRAIIGCLLGGLIGGMAIATAWTFKPEKDFWDIFSAVGTMAAAIVALGISLADTFRRRAVARDRANLAAASISVAIAAAIDAIETAELVLDFYEDEETWRQSKNCSRGLHLMSRLKTSLRSRRFQIVVPIALLGRRPSCNWSDLR